MFEDKLNMVFYGKFGRLRDILKILGLLLKKR
jgi:hypothetical protein